MLKKLQRTELYSKKYGYYCIYVAKSGCSSFRQVFLELHREELDVPPRDYHHLQSFFPLPDDAKKDQIWKLIVVRNPYSRIVSAFFNRYVQCEWAIRKSLNSSGYGLPESDSFSNFMGKLFEIYKNGEIDHLDIHVRRQTYGVDIKDPMLVVVNMEKFKEQIVMAYSKMFGVDHSLTLRLGSLLGKSTIHENATKYAASCCGNFAKKVFAKNDIFPHFSKMYDDQTKLMVEEIYRDDFLRLGYPFCVKQCMLI